MALKKDVLQPMNTGQSPSPSIRRAAKEPANWRAQGEQSVEQAVKDNPTKSPICPEKNK